MKEKIFIYGASGHAKVVIDIIERQSFYDIGFLIDDNQALHGCQIYGYTVLGGKKELLGTGLKYGIVAIGDNRVRQMVTGWIRNNGFQLITAVHPSAQLARGVTIGSGSVVMAGAAINADSSIGQDVIINTRASIDHDCRIADGTHIAPGSTLCGTVTIGEGAFICAGVTIIPNLTIGSNATVGAGSTVIRDVPDDVTVVGSPAKAVRQC